jgi:cholinesterase
VKLRMILAVAVVTLLAGSVGFAQAQGQTFSQIVVLGDSLSDNGNLYAAIGYPPAPYWQGRASNGPVAVEYLAQSLKIPLVDFAWYGATTGVGNVTDSGTVNAFGPWALPGITTVFGRALSVQAFPVDPHALYVVWGGPNDFWYLGTLPTEAPVAIGKAVTNLVTIVSTLRSLGVAEHQILVSNMPDLGKVPGILMYGPELSDFFSRVTTLFNQALRANLPPGVHYFDVSSRLSDIVANPERYGFGNSTDACLTETSLCPNPTEYFFWDIAHPTTMGHALIGNALFQSVAPTVIIGACDSGVPNPLLNGGSSVSDLIAVAAMGAESHGQFVRGVAAIANGLVASGVISGKQKGAIQRCAAAK